MSAARGRAGRPARTMHRQMRATRRRARAVRPRRSAPPADRPARRTACWRSSRGRAARRSRYRHHTPRPAPYNSPVVPATPDPLLTHSSLLARYRLTRTCLPVRGACADVPVVPYALVCCGRAARQPAAKAEVDCRRKRTLQRAGRGDGARQSRGRARSAFRPAFRPARGGRGALRDDGVDETPREEPRVAQQRYGEPEEPVRECERGGEA
eukprot:scaffold57852_cov63-Phaeocystis_antarctica.AAC.3